VGREMFSFFHLGPHFATAPAPIKVTMPSDEKRRSLAAIIRTPELGFKKFADGFYRGSDDDTQDVALLHDEEFLPVDLYLGT
jgi:hypothetical protein